MNSKPIRSEAINQNETESSARIYEDIRNISYVLHRFLMLLPAEIPARDIRALQRFYERYTAYFIEDYIVLSKMYRQGTKCGSIAMHIFVELSRAHWVLTYKTLYDEKQAILDNVEFEQTPMQLFSFSNCLSEFWRTDDTTPIFKFGQAEIIQAVLMLTRRVNEMPYETNTMNDFRLLAHILYTRNCIFFCQTCTLSSLNMEGMYDTIADGQYVANRNYYMLCTIYFNCLMRRLYYYDNIVKKTIDIGDCTQIENWIENDVCQLMGVEGIEDVYALVCDKVFEYPGDASWFYYKYPSLPQTKSKVLDCIRPEQAKLYLGANILTKDPIIAATKGFRPDRRGLSSRMFVLYAIDQWFRATYAVRWLNAVRIDNDKIEQCGDKMRLNKFPCLLQLISGYWVYSHGVVYPTNNIYQTVYTWFYILRRDYDSKLLRIDLSTQINKLFGGQVEEPVGFFL